MCLQEHILGDVMASVGLKRARSTDSEIKEQFLADGGHYELSPMYHSILLWDIADLIYLARTSQLPELVERSDYLSAPR